MKIVLKRLFEEHKFIKQWEDGNLEFYVNSDKNMVSYFIVNYIDCTQFEDKEETVRDALNDLENRYMDFDNQEVAVKKYIAKSFPNSDEIPQIDKNTSAIYVMKFSNIDILNRYRNLIYAIEESSIYFKRYILSYSDIQLEGLKEVIDDYEDKTIETVLTDLADNEDNYYQLLRGKNHNSIYELVIRLFSKIPFLQYHFRATSEEYSLEDMVGEAMDKETQKYDRLVSEGIEEIEKYLDIDQISITEEFINSELDKLLGV